MKSLMPEDPHPALPFTILRRRNAYFYRNRLGVRRSRGKADEPCDEAREWVRASLDLRFACPGAGLRVERAHWGGEAVPRFAEDALKEWLEFQ